MKRNGAHAAAKSCPFVSLRKTVVVARGVTHSVGIANADTNVKGVSATQRATDGASASERCAATALPRTTMSASWPNRVEGARSAGPDHLLGGPSIGCSWTTTTRLAVSGESFVTGAITASAISKTTLIAYGRPSNICADKPGTKGSVEYAERMKA